MLGRIASMLSLMCTADTWSRLWWSESGVSCAYRDAATGQPIYYMGYRSVTWESAPDCDYAATSTNTMPDTKGEQSGCAVLQVYFIAVFTQ